MPWTPVEWKDHGGRGEALEGDASEVSAEFRGGPIREKMGEDICERDTSTVQQEHPDDAHCTLQISLSRAAA